jgi:hypothetical protein
MMLIMILLTIALPICVTCGVLAVRETMRNHHRQNV